MKSQASVILDGREIAKKWLDALLSEIESLDIAGKLCLASVRVGESKEAALYSKAIETLLKKIGVAYEACVFPEKISERELIYEIEKLNHNAHLTGILIFSPLPGHLKEEKILDAVFASKDVEGRRFLPGLTDRAVAPTAQAAVALVEEAGVLLDGKEAVVIGRSLVVGKPAALLLLEKNATVTICHSRTKDLKSHVQRADILIASAGKPHLVRGEWIKPGAIVVDVGVNVVDGKVIGDVEYEAAKERAGFITPATGGVGPLTNVMLVKNLLTLWKSSRS